MDLEFYIDDDGMHCARATSLTAELIAKLEDTKFSGDFIGNGHCVDFRDNSVSIEAMHDEEAPDRVLSRDEMLKHVKAWLTFIS